MSFNNCCNSPQKIEYILNHDDYFSEDQNRAFLDWLWNLPNIQSYQSNHNTIFENPAYDDFLMGLLKEKLGLSNEDIMICSDKGDEPIPDATARYYENEICVNCGKVIIHKRTKYTTIVEFFNHLRDSIAHGCFNVVCGIFIGFDHPKYLGVHWNAVIKVSIDRLMGAISYFVGMTDLTDIYTFCLEKLGYCLSVIKEDEFLATKNEKQYMLVIKHYSGRYINQNDLEDFIQEYAYIDKSNCMFVLVVDSTYASKDTHMHLERQNIAVIDKASLKEMMLGKDVLSELSLLD